MNKQQVLEQRNELERCPCCNANIKDRKITISKNMINALYQVYVWCGKNKVHEFHTKDVKHLFGKSEYARFGDFVRFGGLLYRPEVDGKPKKALYGLNMARAKEFFKGERTIPMQITLNQITNEIVEQIQAYYYEFPSLREMIKEDGLYDHEKNVKIDQEVPAVSKEGKIIKRPVIKEVGGRRVAVFED